MDIDEVRACLRALLSSSSLSCSVKSLLNDFRTMTGFELPLFGCVNPVEFLRTLNDTVLLFGDPFDPQVALVESKKSAHITSLVDRTKSSFTTKRPGVFPKQRRLIVTEKTLDGVTDYKTKTTNQENNKEITTSQKTFRFGNSEFKPEEPDPAFHPTDCGNNSLNQQNSTVSLALSEKSENIFNVKSSSTLKNTAIKRFEGPTEKKAESCYFEDEDCSDNKEPKSNSESVVNDGIKNKCKELIKKHPEGLWCCDLPQVFLKEFNFDLDYKEFGYTSLIQMLSELSDVFRCIRPGNGDWILFDASAPPTAKENKMKDLELGAEINTDIKKNVRELLLNCFETELGVELNNILELYEEKFGSSLDFQGLGFKDLTSLLESWEGSCINIINFDDRAFVVPGSKQTTPSHWEEAVPPITAENDIFAEIFPKEVVGPDESLPELDLMRHVAVGNVVEVTIAEVWSPKKFYLQLNKFKSGLNAFMDGLQNFYNVYVNKYKMPNSTIRPNQICVGLYNSDPDVPEEWHRAQIVKVINEKIVLINFVDYGTVARVKKSQLRFLHRRFQSFPVQAFLAELTGVVPPNNGKWTASTSKKFLELTRVDYLKAEIDDIDFKIPSMSVTLYHPSHKSGISINKKLVLEKLAWIKEPVFEDPFEVPEAKTESRQDVKPETRSQDSKPITEQKNGVKETSRGDALKKNVATVPDEFSDIADLGQTTSFHFKMKSLTLRDSLPSKKVPERNVSLTNSNVCFEFEEVPDLENVEKPEVVEVKDAVKSNLFETPRPSNLKGVSLFQTKMQNPNSRPTENPRKPSQRNRVTVKPSPPPRLSGKPSRLPPGLEHMNMRPNMNQMQFYLQPEDFKKRVNALAMELLTSMPSIRQVGMSDPALALKIATEMAQAFVASQYPGRVPFNRNPLTARPFPEYSFPPVQWQPKGFEMREPAVPVVPVFPVTPPVPKITETTTPDSGKKDFISFEQECSTKISPRKGDKENEYVKLIQIGSRRLHLVKIDERIYFCAEEIVRQFTIIPNRETADRVLLEKKFNPEYKIITKKDDEKVLNAIKSSSITIFKGKSKKLKVYLIPLEKVIPLLQILGVVTKAFEKEFRELQLLKKEESDAGKVELG